MRTIDEIRIAAPIEVVWPLAHRVEEWPIHLAHYRHVLRLEGESAGNGLVEMAAWRPFGSLNWPTWWCSEMIVDHVAHEIHYRHVQGITRGMTVRWSVTAVGTRNTAVSILHEWTGPRWPLIGGFAASRVIGPIFVHGIASRTLAGLARRAEAS